LVSYLNLIERFKPQYCNYGIEATEYIIKNPDDTAKHSTLFNFLHQVYDNIKAAHPDLTLFISVTLKDPDSTGTSLIQGYSDKISACTDILGVSTYGYIFYGHAGCGNPANLPTNWLSHAQNYAPVKKLAIAETAWIAENLTIPAYSVDITGTEEWQKDYVGLLLNEADRLSAEFVTWFCAVDYDTLCTDTLGSDPLSQIWRDTGLYDGDTDSRPALKIWNNWLTISYE